MGTGVYASLISCLFVLICCKRGSVIVAVMV